MTTPSSLFDYLSIPIDYIYSNIFERLTEQQKKVTFVALGVFSILVFCYMLKRIFFNKQFTKLPDHLAKQYLINFKFPIREKKAELALKPNPLNNSFRKDPKITVPPAVQPQAKKFDLNDFSYDSDDDEPPAKVIGKRDESKASVDNKKESQENKNTIYVLENAGKKNVLLEGQDADGILLFPGSVKFIGKYEKGLLKSRGTNASQVIYEKALAPFDKPFVFGGNTIFEPFIGEMKYFIERGEFKLENSLLNGKGKISLRHSVMQIQTGGIGKNIKNSFNPMITPKNKGSLKRKENSSLLFDGSLVRGQPSGKGTMTIRDKNKECTYILDGIFLEGRLHGAGKIEYENYSNSSESGKKTFQGTFIRGTLIQET